MRLFLLWVLICFPVWAHQTSLTSSGNQIYWSNPNVPVAISTNTNDLSSTVTRNIILNSMNEWNQSSSAKVNSVGSSQNTISFQSGFAYGSAVLGVTELSYNSSGSIEKASIVLNDDYAFQASPGIYPSGQVYLGDVVTHELGHLFGLSHSEVLNSTMFYSSFSGQSTLSPDDKGGIRLIYDSSFGSIYGYVKGGNSVGVLGAHVQAISRKTGESIGAISDEDGMFVIGGLDLEDTYYLYVSPVKNVDSLPGYFANVQNNFCPGVYSGSFYSVCGRENDGKPQGINLSSFSPHVDVGTISISCSLKTDPDYDAEKLESSFSTLTFFDYAQDLKSEKAFVGWFRKAATITWSAEDKLGVDLTGYTSLGGFQKYLKVSLVSFPFGSQNEYELSFSRNGSSLGSGIKPLIYDPGTETYSTDYETFLPLDPNRLNNNFEIGIKSRKLSSSTVAQTFPSPSLFSTDQYLPYLLITSLYEMRPSGLTPIIDTQANLSDNQSCLEAPFTYAVSKSSNNDTSPVASSDQVAAAAGCGTIEPPSSGGSGSFPLIAFGFLLSFLASALVKSRKNFLS